jgi:hypothetical protein
LAAQRKCTPPSKIGASAIEAWAQALRAVILSIPQEQRSAVIAHIHDILPVSLNPPPRAPHRGGDVLNNIYELFRREPAIARAAPEVVRELAKVGVTAEPQTVRNALNYLNSRRIVQRIGYGRYIMEDGSVVEGPP